MLLIPKINVVFASHSRMPLLEPSGREMELPRWYGGFTKQIGDLPVYGRKTPDSVDKVGGVEAGVR